MQSILTECQISCVHSEFEMYPYLSTFPLQATSPSAVGIKSKVGQEIQARGWNLSVRLTMGPKREWHGTHGGDWRGTKCGRKWKSFAKMALHVFPPTLRGRASAHSRLCTFLFKN